MDEYISISNLNDFIFCPYSIYLQAVYMETDEDLYKASPQLLGNNAHKSSSEKNYSTRTDEIMSLPVFSNELGITGIIDNYKTENKILIERKNNLKHIFKGQIYQLWAQYFCMKEMGYPIDRIAFYEISTNKMIYQPLPTEKDKSELKLFIESFRTYSPGTTPFAINSNKCRHCIYCNLCDKAIEDNVYT